MDNQIINILIKCGLDFSGNTLNGSLIERDSLLSETVYEKVVTDIEMLRNKYSSSGLTALQKNAKEDQKWPLLNLVRQLLRMNGFNMKPVRRSNGYSPDGKKKYKRFFLINKLSKEQHDFQ